MRSNTSDRPHGHRGALTAGARWACVWGLGHIGGETVRRLAAAGVNVVGYDVDERKARMLAGDAAIKDAEVSCTAERVAALDRRILVHFVAVPTERTGEPFLGHLEDVLSAIASTATECEGPPPLVVIESTVIPGATQNRLIPLCESRGAILEETLLLALAPRRDWLVGPQEMADGIDRVFGGVGPRSANAARSVLSLLHDRLHSATSLAVVELVKCAENASRHLQIMLGNQLSLAYPDIDVAEVLSLAGTKWNIETVHPSFGTGGYCVPLSSKYLLSGARHRSELSLPAAALETESRMRQLVAARLGGRRHVAILGLAYRGGVKVATLSPTIEIVQHLTSRGVPHSVYDPLYTSDEISQLCGGAGSDDFPEALRRADAVLVVTDHEEFRSPEVREALFAPRRERLLVLDSPGLLSDWGWPVGTDYYRAGEANWLENCAKDVDGGAH